jgi:large subunit ribosomal protein L20
MPRSRPKVYAHRRHKKVIKSTKGQFGGRSRLYKTANEARLHALHYAYRDRRTRKREMRKLWVLRINAAARENGLNYSRFMHGLSLAEVDMDRKVLADLAVHDGPAFTQLAEVARAQLA